MPLNDTLATVKPDGASAGWSDFYGRWMILKHIRTVASLAADYNQHWLLERHAYRTPRQARDTLRHTAMA